VFGSPVTDENGKVWASLVSFTDITERKKADEELRETNAYLENLINYANAPIIVWDPHFAITRFNHAFEELTGRTENEVAGKSLEILFPSDQVAASMDLIRKTSSGERWKVVEIQILHMDGSIRTVLWNSATLFSSDGKNPVATIAQGQDITDRKQAEISLRETNQFLENLINYANAPIIVWDTQFRIARFNHAFEALTGRSEQEVLGQPLEILFPADQVGRSMELISRTFSGEHWEVVEIRILHVDGSIRTVLWNSATLFDADGITPLTTIAQGQDITERKQAEDMLEARLQLIDFSTHHSLEELLQDTLDKACAMTESPIGFYHFVEADQKTLSLQAWSTRTLQEFCHAEGKGMHYPVEQAGVWADSVRQKKAIIHNDYPSLENRKGLPAEHAEVLRELVVPILREEQVVAILGIGNKPQLYTEKDVEIVTYFADVAWEIAERKRAEQQLASYAEHLAIEVNERTSELRAAQEQLVRQERLALMGQLAGSIGHELRNPLGVISNAVYFLKMAQPDASDKVKEYLTIIENEARTSDKIVTDLLDFTRLKSVDREAVSLSDLVGETLERFPVPSSVAVIRKIPADLPMVYVDSQHMIQVLRNLTVNACQAMVSKIISGISNGISVGGTLTFSANFQQEMVCLHIQDTGVGIPAENLPKLFEPLFTTKIKGIGLGLAVSKKLIEANGGRIEVKSEAGVGSTFSIWMPVK
jgi:PAS domain S-box-containing protein